MIERRNLFADITATAGETFETLAQGGNVKIERIISRSQASPSGFWYDQETDEWVMLAQGEAVLEFESGPVLEMKKGDHMMIPRRMKHRVAKTSADAVWLAVHWNRS